MPQLPPSPFTASPYAKQKNGANEIIDITTPLRQNSSFHSQYSQQQKRFQQNQDQLRIQNDQDQLRLQNDQDQLRIQHDQDQQRLQHDPSNQQKNQEQEQDQFQIEQPQYQNLQPQKPFVMNQQQQSAKNASETSSSPSPLLSANIMAKQIAKNKSINQKQQQSSKQSSKQSSNPDDQPSKSPESTIKVFDQNDQFHHNQNQFHQQPNQSSQSSHQPNQSSQNQKAFQYIQDQTVEIQSQQKKQTNDKQQSQLQPFLQQNQDIHNLQPQSNQSQFLQQQNQDIHQQNLQPQSNGSQFPQQNQDIHQQYIQQSQFPQQENVSLSHKSAPQQDQHRIVQQFQQELQLHSPNINNSSTSHFSQKPYVQPKQQTKKFVSGISNSITSIQTLQHITTASQHSDPILKKSFQHPFHSQNMRTFSGKTTTSPTSSPPAKKHFHKQQQHLKEVADDELAMLPNSVEEEYENQQQQQQPQNEMEPAEDANNIIDFGQQQSNLKEEANRLEESNVQTADFVNNYEQNLFYNNNIEQYKFDNQSEMHNAQNNDNQKVVEGQNFDPLLQQNLITTDQNDIAVEIQLKMADTTKKKKKVFLE